MIHDRDMYRNYKMTNSDWIESDTIESEMVMVRRCGFHFRLKVLNAIKRSYPITREGYQFSIKW